MKDIPLEILFERIDRIRETYGAGVERPGHGRRPDAARPRRARRDREAASPSAASGPRSSRTGSRPRATSSPSSRPPASSTSRSTWTRRSDASATRPRSPCNAIRREYIERARGLGLAVIFNTTVHAGNLDEIPASPASSSTTPTSSGWPRSRCRPRRAAASGGTRAPEVTMPAIRERITAARRRRARSRGTPRSSGTRTATRPRCSRRSAAAPWTSSPTRPSTSASSRSSRTSRSTAATCTGTALHVVLGARPQALVGCCAAARSSCSRLWRVRRELLRPRADGQDHVLHPELHGRRRARRRARSRTARSWS